MSVVEYLGGDKVKQRDSLLPIQATFTDKNANDLKNSNNEQEQRIINIETSGIGGNIDGGASATVYLAPQVIDGGNA